MIKSLCSSVVLLVFAIGLPAAGFGLSHDIEISVFPPDRSLLAVDRITVISMPGRHAGIPRRRWNRPYSWRSPIRRMSNW